MSGINRQILMTGLIATAVAVFAASCNNNNPTPDPSNSQSQSGVGGGGGPSGPPSVLTYHNDLARTGQNLQEATLTRQNVNSTTFGKIGAFPVDGLVYAQPLYVPGVSIGGTSHNVLYVATEHDSVYAFDADSLSTTPLWQRNFVSDCLTSPSTPSNCSTASPVDTGAPNVSPEIGITATPVIDPEAGVIYVAAYTKESGLYYWRIHAMDITTGAEKTGSPVTVDWSFPGTGLGTQTDGLIYFDPPRQLSRAGLVLSDGLLYVAFTSFDDQEPSHGWLVAYNSSTLDPVSAWVSTPNSGVGTIWMAGGAPAVDSSGNLFFSTGNGEAQYFETTQGGPPNTFTDLSDSVIKLNFGADGFELADYFTPYNYQSLAIGDVELGSGGVTLLPDQPGSHPHLMVAGGKEGTFYLLDRDNLGKLNTAANATSDPQIVQELVGDLPGGQDNTGNFSTPSYFNGAIFIAENGDSLRKIPLSDGLLDWASMTSTNNPIQHRGATTSISANGSSDGIVWYADPSAYTYSVTSGYPPTLTYGPPVLYAYSTDDLSKPLYASNQVSSDAPGCPITANTDSSGSTPNVPGSGAGCAVKFAVPTVIAGKVFIGSDTEVTVYGLRNSIAMNTNRQLNREVASVRNVTSTTSSDVLPAVPFSFERENACQLDSKRKDGALF